VSTLEMRFNNCHKSALAYSLAQRPLKQTVVLLKEPSLTEVRLTAIYQNKEATGLQGFEPSRLSRFLDNRLTDGGEVNSP
jgi:hypothetical protein